MFLFLQDKNQNTERNSIMYLPSYKHATVHLPFYILNLSPGDSPQLLLESAAFGNCYKHPQKPGRNGKNKCHQDICKQPLPNIITLPIIR